jgi:hypothetical protein
VILVVRFCLCPSDTRFPLNIPSSSSGVEGIANAGDCTAGTMEPGRHEARIAAHLEEMIRAQMGA